jgi:cobalamin biosynthesis protein CobD/CbiB
MKPPNIRATARHGRRVTVEITDRVVRRTMRQKRVLVQNRVDRLAHWMNANGVGRHQLEPDAICFEDEGDATLFYLAFA